MDTLVLKYGVCLGQTGTGPNCQNKTTTRGHGDCCFDPALPGIPVNAKVSVNRTEQGGAQEKHFLSF